jgi:hypothetical protein
MSENARERVAGKAASLGISGARSVLRFARKVGWLQEFAGLIGVCNQ